MNSQPTGRYVTTAVAGESRVRSLYRQINTERQQPPAQQGATVTAIQLFERLPEHPVITMALVTRLLETSKPTAGKAIELLVAAGILAEVGERKRDRLYRYQSYLQLLE